MGVAATVVLVGHAGPRLAEFHTLCFTRTVLALTAALLCLCADTPPPAQR